MSEMTYAVHTATCTYLLDEDGICRWTHAPIGVAPPGAERCVGAQFVACLDPRSEGGLVGELCIGAAALFVRQEEGRFVLLRTLPIENVELRPGMPVSEPRPALGPVEDPHSFAETPIFIREEETPMALPAFSMAADPPSPPAPPAAHETAPLPSWALTTHGHPQGPPPGPPASDPLPRFASLPAAEEAARAAYASLPSSWNPDETAPLDPRWSTPGEVLDLEDLLSVSVTEVTLSLPLYRSPLTASVDLPEPPGAPDEPPRAPGLPRSAIVNPGRRLR